MYVKQTGMAMWWLIITPFYLKILVRTFSIQAAAYGSVDGSLTEEMIDQCVNEMIEQHKQKTKWQDSDIPGES